VLKIGVKNIPLGQIWLISTMALGTGRDLSIYVEFALLIGTLLENWKRLTGTADNYSSDLP